VVSLSDWIRDWRRIADLVPEGICEPVTVRRGDREYEILLVSVYDPEVDGSRRMVRTGAREFDDKVALFTHLTRDTGAVRVISMRGRPRFVLEPGGDVVDWAADVEGVSVHELTQAVREGALGSRVARLAVHQERRSRGRLEAEVQALRERAEDAEAEALLLRGELRARERDLSRFGAE